jgi:uncharacterized protein YprB with RNaseH-like and TPR domain
MSTSLQDRLSRVRGLRPTTGTGDHPHVSTAWDVLPAAAEHLDRLLGAQQVSNHYGDHLAFRCWYSHPEQRHFSLDALRLLAPGLHPDAANPEKWLFLDTETTGLAGGTGTYAFLIGLAWWDAGGLQVEQLFMRDLAEEHSVLLALKERLAERPVLVTFNGKTFDWPLLETRFRMTRCIQPSAPRAHLDLLHPARHLWRLRLGSVKLSELEHHILGRPRDENVISAMIPKFYFDFLRGGPAQPLAPVFRHNRLDLQGLAAIAMRALELLSSPADEDSSAGHTDALDIFSLARFCERRGELQRACRHYRDALNRHVPSPHSRVAQLHLARIAKIGGDLALAHSLWEKLCGDSPEGLAAYEQLAIHHEHSARHPERAAQITRTALGELRKLSRRSALSSTALRRWLDRLEHRLLRLDVKLSKKKSSAIFPGKATVDRQNSPKPQIVAAGFGRIRR